MVNRTTSLIEKLQGEEPLDADERKLLASMLKNFTGPFIHGDAGAKDTFGLAEYLFVCPQYGLEGSAVYKKHKDYSAPGW